MIGVKLEPQAWYSSACRFPQALAESVRENVKNATLIYQFLRGMVERRMSPKSLAGPIGIVQISGEAAREGPTAYFGLMAMAQPESGDCESVAHSDSGRRERSSAAGGDVHAPRFQPARQGNSVPARFCFPDGGGGVCALQRYLEAGRLNRSGRGVSSGPTNATGSKLDSR